MAAKLIRRPEKRISSEGEVLLDRPPQRTQPRQRSTWDHSKEERRAEGKMTEKA